MNGVPLLVTSDILNAVSTVVFNYVEHSDSNMIKSAGFNLVSSIVSRIVSSMLSGGAIDPIFQKQTQRERKRPPRELLTRTAIAKVMNERGSIWRRGFESDVVDILADEMLRISNYNDGELFGAIPGINLSGGSRSTCRAKQSSKMALVCAKKVSCVCVGFFD